MLERIKVSDGVAVTVQTRATGSVRLSMDHAFVDLQRCEMSPSEAVILADALSRAAEIIQHKPVQPLTGWPEGPESFGGA